MMTIFKEPEKLQRWARARKAAGKKIALIPTMGFLHEGHLSLIAAAKKRGAQEIIVSVFVNPVQFGPNEDYDKYPRDDKGDVAKCKAAGATALFVPQPGDMYAADHSVYINEEQLSKGLCGARRPGHFRGVCTVVAKLFNICQPDMAIFGQKDYQQAQVIKRMVRDLNFDVKIIVSSIVREADGLAKSSRNTYLSEKERKMALALSEALRNIGKTNRLPWGFLTPIAQQRVTNWLKTAGLKVDYVEFVDPETLQPVSRVKKGVVALVAAYAGKTRLIDNRML